MIFGRRLDALEVERTRAQRYYVFRPHGQTFKEALSRRNDERIQDELPSLAQSEVDFLAWQDCAWPIKSASVPELIHPLRIKAQRID